MNDAQTIQSAYAQALGRLFEVFLGSLASAGGDADAEAQAAQVFQHGVALARKARDEAVKLVQ